MSEATTEFELAVCCNCKRKYSVQCLDEVPLHRFHCSLCLSGPLSEYWERKGGYPQLTDDEIFELENGRKIQAIRFMRRRLGSGLKETKAAIDAYEMGYRAPWGCADSLPVRWAAYLEGLGVR